MICEHRTSQAQALIGRERTFGSDAQVVEEYGGVRPTQLCDSSFGARCGALQKVVIPPLPREDVKCGILTPAAMPPSIIVIVLPLN